MPRSAKFLVSRCFPRGQGVPQVTPCATAAAWPSSQRTQAPAPGFGVEMTGDGARLLAGLEAAAPRTAVVAALVEMNCRREMRFFI